MRKEWPGWRERNRKRVRGEIEVGRGGGRPGLDTGHVSRARRFLPPWPASRNRFTLLQLSVSASGRWNGERQGPGSGKSRGTCGNESFAERWRFEGGVPGKRGNVRELEAVGQGGVGLVLLRRSVARRLWRFSRRNKRWFFWERKEGLVWFGNETSRFSGMRTELEIRVWEYIWETRMQGRKLSGPFDLVTIRRPFLSRTGDSSFENFGKFISIYQFDINQT